MPVSLRQPLLHLGAVGAERGVLVEDRRPISNFCPDLAPKSFRKSNISCEKVSSVGEVRKKYLRPRCVSAGCEDSALRKGMPARSAAWLAAAVTEEK